MNAKTTLQVGYFFVPYQAVSKVKETPRVSILGAEIKAEKLNVEKNEKGQIWKKMVLFLFNCNFNVVHH